jgi:Cu-processing system permease protein
VYPVIAKPLSRWEYVVGRYLGFSAALLLNLAAMGAVLGATLALQALSLAPIDAPFVSAVAMIGVQVLAVAAVAVLFSCVTSVTLASIFGLAVAAAGHLTNDMRAFWKGAAWIRDLVWYVVPNLSALSQNEAVVYRTPVSAGAWIAAVYGLLYAAAALALAAFAFERRDLR